MFMWNLGHASISIFQGKDRCEEETATSKKNKIMKRLFIMSTYCTSEFVAVYYLITCIKIYHIFMEPAVPALLQSILVGEVLPSPRLSFLRPILLTKRRVYAMIVIELVPVTLYVFPFENH